MGCRRVKQEVEESEKEGREMGLSLKFLKIT